MDPDDLIRTSEAGTNLPFADDRGSWRGRLELLCSDLETTAALTPLGRTIAHGQLVAALSNRARALALWKRHPEIERQPIPQPIIVVGQMRSGTTRVQRLLACDPRLAFTRFYESWSPIPRTIGRGLLDDRKLRSRLGLMSAKLLNPEFDTIHPTAWNAADEEIGFHSLSIFGSAFEVQWRVPNFAAAVEGDDGDEVYAEFRQLLKTVAWLRREDGSRPWILKVPQFTQDLPALLRVFPDARLIFVNRNRHQVIASSASLVRNQMAVQSEQVDLTGIGREWTRKFNLRERRMDAFGESSSGPSTEVSFENMNQNWEGELRNVYFTLALDLPAEVLSKMRNLMLASRSGSHLRHTYRAGDFGLDADQAPPTHLSTGSRASNERGNFLPT